jgi:hypothetical protein
MRNQESILAATSLILAQQQEMRSLIKTRVVTHREASTSSAATGVVETITRQEWTKPRLRWLGIRCRRTITHVRIPGQRRGRLGNAANTIIDDREEIFFHWQFFGCEFYVSRQYPYGSVVPSLRIFPIVESFRQHEDMFQKASVTEWQQAFETGALHPFARTPEGRTLLHVSSVTHSTLHRKTNTSARKLSSFAE